MRAGLVLGALFFAAVSGRAQSAPSLFNQAAVEVLGREFASKDISYLVVDPRTGNVLLDRWEDSSRPIPMGSLVKPFTALAYAEHHSFLYPELPCRGEASGCWRVRPHGNLNISEAVSYSCNSYFRALAAGLSGADVRPTAMRFGLDPPDDSLTGPALMGLGSRWPVAPRKMAEAYLELYRRRDQPGVGPLLLGMAEAAQKGTGSGAGRTLKHTRALVKTGTAPCTHDRPAPGDGFVVVLLPAENPELLLLLRVHSVPGARAAETAGRMLGRLEE